MGTGCTMQNAANRAATKRAVSGCILTLALSASFLSAGCTKAQPPSISQPAIDLSGQFSIGSGSPDSLKMHMNIIRKGERKDALVLLAPAVMRASLKELKGARIFKCWAAPVFNIGDGIQMSVFIRRSGNRILAGSRYFDPGRKAEDRSWISLAIPVDINPGDQLEVEVSAGPQGDLVADWLAFNSLQLTP